MGRLRFVTAEVLALRFGVPEQEVDARVRLLVRAQRRAGRAGASGERDPEGLSRGGAGAQPQREHASRDGPACLLGVRDAGRGAASDEVVDPLGLAAEMGGGLGNADPRLGGDALPASQSLRDLLDDDLEHCERKGQRLFTPLFTQGSGLAARGDDLRRVLPASSLLQVYGETRTRTGDTTIFSRVLYQLSYLAAVEQGSRGGFGEGLRHGSTTGEDPMAGSDSGNVTGTADKDYNIIWFTEQCLSNVLRLEQYAKDAEGGGDQELADFFRRAQDTSRKGAEQGKALLKSRLS